MNKIFLGLAFFIAMASMSFVPMEAGAPTCHSHSSGPYCNYNGKVKSAYINSGNVILMYFDTPFSNTDVPSSVGLSIGTSGQHAAAFVLTENNKIFGQSLYSTILTALAADKTVTVQLRGNYGVYLKIDRIWIAKD